MRKEGRKIIIKKGYLRSLKNANSSVDENNLFETLLIHVF